MTEFYQTIRERKSLANQSRHRKNGSKSKKCTLPTDFMTEKQIKERNGPVMSYNLGAPMSWAEFKKIPIEHQREYLRSLVDKFGVTASKVGDMFGVSIATMSRLTNKPELDFRFKIGKRQTKEQEIAWQRFLDGELYTEEVALAESQATDECGLEWRPVKEDILAIPKRPKMAMDRFSLSFGGPIDIDMIANSLRHIVGSDAVGNIEINCVLY